MREDGVDWLNIIITNSASKVTEIQFTYTMKLDQIEKPSKSRLRLKCVFSTPPPIFTHTAQPLSSS